LAELFAYQPVVKLDSKLSRTYMKQKSRMGDEMDTSVYGINVPE
jgi:hypothetical protein